MASESSKNRIYQNFVIVKCVIPHYSHQQKYPFMVADKITHNFHVAGVNVKNVLNDLQPQFQHMPVSLAILATEQAVVEYIAVPRDGLKETWSLMKEWAKTTLPIPFMATFWRMLFEEAGNQLAVMFAKETSKIVAGIPMELLTEELMKELFPDDDNIQ